MSQVRKSIHIKSGSKIFKEEEVFQQNDSVKNNTSGYLKPKRKQKVKLPSLS